MKEIIPGVHHWIRPHEGIGSRVSSYYFERERTLVDPMVPEELDSLDWFREHGPPDRILLTNRHHYRHSDRFLEAFDLEVWCSAAGMHEFTRGEPVTPFEPGATLAEHFQSIEIGALCPDETALFVPQARAVCIADGVIRREDGPLQFVPDFLMGDDPLEVKKGLQRAYRRLLELDFDHLLLAHGQPWIGGARDALSAWLKEPIEP